MLTGLLEGTVGVLLLALVVLVLVFLILRGLASLYQKVPPNTALIVFGGRRGHKGYQIIKGGGTIVVPFFESTRMMSLELMSLDITSVEANSSQGVKITVDAVAQVKIGGTDEAMATAAEQLLNKESGDIQTIAMHTLQGHLRGIIATLTVEEIYKEREAFQAHVTNQAKTDFANMGLEIVSLTVKEINDSHGYMEALGKPRIAQVLRDANIAEAEANKETQQKVAAAHQAAREAELAAEVAVALATRDKDVQVAQFQATSKTELAKADKAYDLQAAEINRDLALKNGAVTIEQRRQEALAAQEAIQVAQNLQQASIVIPAQAQREQAIAEATGRAESVKLQAGGESEATKLRAQAEAERTRITGEAEGQRLQAIGKGEAAANEARLLAEAAGQKSLADARAADDQINLRQFTIEQYFKTQLGIGEAMAQALAQVGSKITFTQIGPGNGKGNGMVELLEQLPELAAIFNAKNQALGGQTIGEIMQTVGGIVKAGNGADGQAAGDGEAQSKT